MIWNWLINDVISNNQKTIYAKRGELVTIISNNHFPIMCVMTKDRNKFTTHLDNISNTKINKDETTTNQQGNNVKTPRRVKR
jgi:hypothetical protein